MWLRHVQTLVFCGRQTSDQGYLAEIFGESVDRATWLLSATEREMQKCPEGDLVSAQEADLKHQPAWLQKGHSGCGQVTSGETRTGQPLGKPGAVP